MYLEIFLAPPRDICRALGISVAERVRGIDSNLQSVIFLYVKHEALLFVYNQ